MLRRELNSSSGRDAKDILNKPQYPPLEYFSCSLHSQRLRDIAGIAKFKNLEHLDLSCNSIMTIASVASLTNLKTLKASYNQV